MPNLIALLTDYGTKDWFTAEMKAVILDIAPSSTILDITHAVKPADFRSAAFILLASYKSFPQQTVFCIGVNSSSESQASLIVQVQNYYFVSPDNGILSWITNRNNSLIWRIENKNFFRSSAPTTFLGRDILGPAAAFLSIGTPPAQFGPTISEITDIAFPHPSIRGSQIESEIVYIDHFGNAITTIEPSHLTSIGSPSSIKVIKSGYEMPLKTNYYEVQIHNALGYIGSAGFIEIGINKGSASEELNLHIGDKIILS